MGGVIASGPRAGLRVAIDPADTCERCEACVAGHTNLCDATRFRGTPGCDGALAELMAWPSRLLVPVPDAHHRRRGAAARIAGHRDPLGGPGARASRDARVGVYGAGPIGLLIVAMLRARGVGRIVVTEPLAHRRAAALAMGADVALDADPDGRRGRRSGSRWTSRSRRPATDAGIATARAGRSGRRTRGARGHPQHRDVRAPRRRRAAQGPHVPGRAADAGAAPPAGGQPRRGGRGADSRRS